MLAIALSLALPAASLAAPLIAKSRVIILSDFPPLDVVPSGAGQGPAELNRFLGKLRIYMIGLGDKTGQDGSGQWMLDHFPNLFMIVSQKTYGGMFAQTSPLGNLEWLNAHVREGHGPLGAVYPRSGFNPNNPGMQEGDTPSFLYLYSAVRGMNDPEKPDQESWGGQYVQRNPAKKHWYDGPGAKSVSKWLPDMQTDFARRMDWCNQP